jgi:hypothetical protein
MQSKHLLAAVAALSAATLACTVGPNLSPITTGPTQTLALNEPLPAGVDVVELELNMAAGQLSVSGGGDGVVEGEIRYNVSEWAPVVDNQGDRLTVTQGNNDSVSGIPNSQVINDWALKLGDIPYNLSVNAGAYEGTWIWTACRCAV